MNTVYLGHQTQLGVYNQNTEIARITELIPVTLKINVYNIYVLPMATYGFETMDVVKASACNYNNHSAL